MTQAAWGTLRFEGPGARQIPFSDSLHLPRTLFYLGVASLGLLTLRPVGGLTLSDLFFFAALALAITSHMLSRSWAGRIDQKMFIGSLLYAIGALLSAFGNEDSLQSLDVAVRLLFLVVGWFWLSTVLLKTTNQVRLAATLWVLSVGSSGIAALVQLLAGDVIPGSTTIWGRMTGFTGHPNDLGGASAVALVAGLTLLVAFPTGLLHRVALLIGVLACLAGIFLSGSVSAFMGAATAVAGLTFFYHPSARKVLVVVTLAVTGALMILLQNQFDTATPTLRFEATTGENGTLATRTDVLQVSLQGILSNPFLGVGPTPGGTVVESTDSRAHNAFIATWYESGVLGVVGFVLIVGGAIGVALAATRRSSNKDRALAAGLAWAFCAYLIFGLAQPTLYVRYGWIAVGLLAALWAQQQSESEREKDLRPLSARTGFGEVPRLG